MSIQADIFLERPFIVAVFFGACWGAYSAQRSGGNVLLGALKGGLSAAVSGAMFYAAGNVIAVYNITNTAGVVVGNSLSALQQAGVHSVASAFSSAVNSAMMGGDVGQGALNGALSAGAAKGLGEYLGAEGARLIVGTVAGGVSASVSGGDFVQGAF